MRKTIYILTIPVLLLSLSLTAWAQRERGQATSQEHRSQVADVVMSLTELASQDQNIGEEVRAVAQAQEQSNERASDAMAAFETRGKFRTFLFGTDYKNIGVIRSELVTTQNHINRLTQAKERTDDKAVQAELDEQIAALEASQAETQAFVEEHESQFSLLGWLVRLFS